MHIGTSILNKALKPDLSGIDPRIGQHVGFGGVIIHGLATYGFAARSIVAKVGMGDPMSLKAIAARFTSPIKPGGT